MLARAVAGQPGDRHRSGAAAASPDDQGDAAPTPGPGAGQPQRLAGLVLEDDPAAEGPAVLLSFDLNTASRGLFT